MAAWGRVPDPQGRRRNRAARPRKDGLLTPMMSDSVATTAVHGPRAPRLIEVIGLLQVKFSSSDANTGGNVGCSAKTSQVRTGGLVSYQPPPPTYVDTVRTIEW